MTYAERHEVQNQLEKLPSFLLRMMVFHPNMVAEYADNELTVRKIKAKYNVHENHLSKT